MKPFQIEHLFLCVCVFYGYFNKDFFACPLGLVIASSTLAPRSNSKLFFFLNSFFCLFEIYNGV